MRFIRKNGRVIPIRDDNDTGGVASRVPQTAAGGYSKQTVLGVVSGGFRHLGMREINEGAVKANMFQVRRGVGLTSISRVLTLASLGYAVKKAHDVYKERGNSWRGFAGEFGKHIVSREFGSLAGTGAATAGTLTRAVRKLRIRK